MEEISTATDAAGPALRWPLRGRRFVSHVIDAADFAMAGTSMAPRLNSQIPNRIHLSNQEDTSHVNLTASAHPDHRN
jgi:hypothetical protein